MVEPAHGFWARQFGPEVTTQQTVFDVTLGVVLPILCLVFDPVVFRDPLLHGTGLLGQYAPAAYFFFALSIAVLLIWLATRRFALLLVGPLVAGAAVSLGLGVVLLPFSLVAILLAIGLLGLVPFATSFVFLRNAIRAIRAARVRSGEGRVGVVALLLGSMALGLPAGGHVYVKRKVASAVRFVLHGNPGEQDRAVETLRFLRAIAPTDDVVYAWEREQDPMRKDRLARLYEEITGRDVSVRWYELRGSD